MNIDKAAASSNSENELANFDGVAIKKTRRKRKPIVNQMKVSLEDIMDYNL